MEIERFTEGPGDLTLELQAPPDTGAPFEFRRFREQLRPGQLPRDLDSLREDLESQLDAEGLLPERLRERFRSFDEEFRRRREELEREFERRRLPRRSTNASST